MKNDPALQFRLGKTQDFFETPEEFEQYIKFFFKRIKDIVSKENMILKWQSVECTLEMLNNATEIAEVDIVFVYSDGYWLIDRFGCKEDLINLPVVAKVFSRMYRFQKGHDKSPKERFYYGGEIYQISGQRND